MNVLLKIMTALQVVFMLALILPFVWSASGLASEGFTQGFGFLLPIPLLCLLVVSLIKTGIKSTAKLKKIRAEK